MFWTRESIKEYAKGFLRNYYWKAFVVCLIVAIVGVGTSNNSNRIFKKQKIRDQIENTIEYESGSRITNRLDRAINRPLDRISRTVNRPSRMISIMAIPRFFLKTTIGLIFGVVALIMLVLKITLGYSLEVGKNRFFLEGFKGDADVGNLFSTFNAIEYFGIVKTQFIKGLYIFLWSLLFVIPGIIKTYEYFMVPYILAEYPNLDTHEVLQISKEMTYGHKMDIFILKLSFIGWNILGGLLMGIGIFFINPYKEATYARLYDILAGNDDTSARLFV